MKKKSMVLLITILFISAMSILIYKNLEDTSSYIKEQNHKLNKAQVSSLLKNIKEEVSNVLKKYENNLNVIYDKTFPFTLNNIELYFTLNTYTKLINLNDIFEDEKSQKYQKLKQALFSRGFSDIKLLRKTSIELLDNSYINTNKQVDAIISNYIKNYDSRLLDIKDEIGFLEIAEDEKLVLLNVNIIYLDDIINAKYILSGEKVRYFELSFK
jgi:hypothetical protein